MSKPKVKFRGRQILLFGLVALVLAAGYYRWSTEKGNFLAVPATNETLPAQEQSGDGNNSQSSIDAIAKAKQDRDVSRGEAMDNWKKIADSTEASTASKKEAEENIKKITGNMEKESSIETLVKTKGFDDCFALIDGSGVNVIVAGGELDSANVAQIKDIIVAQTDVAAKDIKISAQ